MVVLNNSDCSLSEQQRQMHKDVFDKIKRAIENRFYLEAIFLEYSALEGRLEVMAGILNLPCNKFLDPIIRKDIKISTRIECLKKSYKVGESIFAKSYLDKCFWKDLEVWIKNRNMYMHGLFKNAELYNNRLTKVRALSEKGYDLINLLYKEANRIRREQNKTEYAFTANSCKLKCKFLQNN